MTDPRGRGGGRLEVGDWFQKTVDWFFLIKKKSGNDPLPWGVGKQ